MENVLHPFRSQWCSDTGQSLPHCLLLKHSHFPPGPPQAAPGTATSALLGISIWVSQSETKSSSGLWLVTASDRSECDRRNTNYSYSSLRRGRKGERELKLLVISFLIGNVFHNSYWRQPDSTHAMIEGLNTPYHPPFCPLYPHLRTLNYQWVMGEFIMAWQPNS